MIVVGMGKWIARVDVEGGDLILQKVKPTLSIVELELHRLQYLSPIRVLYFSYDD